ncbi:hypothetical protein AK812_SmicGene12939 [Symbiodinium microadriaticum]|uniref:Uncharacterized protein n=1 Tax=Symbiodinium microadriaticum TaxID=2951 RepID=A0A1Q9E9E3_SYMMI|nr:hypothetical protein AK812_SmicGene12939 [Symbiodinium microadriaticum]
MKDSTCNRRCARSRKDARRRFLPVGLRVAPMAQTAPAALPRHYLSWMQATAETAISFGGGVCRQIEGSGKHHSDMCSIPPSNADDFQPWSGGATGSKAEVLPEWRGGTAFASNCTTLYGVFGDSGPEAEAVLDYLKEECLQRWEWTLSNNILLTRFMKGQVKVAYDPRPMNHRNADDFQPWSGGATGSKAEVLPEWRGGTAFASNSTTLYGVFGDSGPEAEAVLDYLKEECLQRWEWTLSNNILLTRSTKYIQKDICAKCIPGQREAMQTTSSHGREEPQAPRPKSFPNGGEETEGTAFASNRTTLYGVFGDSGPEAEAVLDYLKEECLQRWEWTLSNNILLTRFMKGQVKVAYDPRPMNHRLQSGGTESYHTSDGSEDGCPITLGTLLDGQQSRVKPDKKQREAVRSMGEHELLDMLLTQLSLRAKEANHFETLFPVLQLIHQRLLVSTPDSGSPRLAGAMKRNMEKIMSKMRCSKLISFVQTNPSVDSFFMRQLEDGLNGSRPVINTATSLWL